MQECSSSGAPPASEVEAVLPDGDDVLLASGELSCDFSLAGGDSSTGMCFADDDRAAG